MSKLLNRWAIPLRAIATFLALAAAACGPPPAATPIVPDPQSPVSAERPIPYAVTPSPAFERAIARGTRTRTGEPGTRYWQQFAEYTLRATLEPGAGVLRGTGTVKYHNRSPDALDRVVVHLYPNLNAPDARRNRRVPVTEAVRLSRVSLNGAVLSQLTATDTAGVGYRVDGTVATLRPQRPIRAGDTATLEFAWSFPVPPLGNPRWGEDGEVFHLAYWYPQIAVYDDVNGWDTDQYLGTAEFYMGYADYDVTITAPTGWLVSATGELTNARDVIPLPIRQRLARARETGEVVNVVAARERAPGVSTGRAARLNWNFVAKNVRDFAFNASNRYVWDATHALVRNADGAGIDTVMINVLYRPGTRSWDRAAEFARHSLEFFSNALWPYPYPQMTLVEGIIGGGMEYPMITLIGSGTAGRTERSMYSTTAHEIAHMWFPMHVGNNERRFTWMEEGLATFLQRDAMADFFPNVPRDSLRVDRYVPLARAQRDMEMMRHGDMYESGAARTAAAYDKPAMVFRALRAMMGDDAFSRALREYGRRWINRHPEPWDFFNTFNVVGGRRIDWFWRSWFYETWVLDQAIASVAPQGRDLLVTIEDRGQVPMPVWLVVTRDNGLVERIDVPVETWLSGRRSHAVTVRGGASVRAIEIDPGLFFPDVDRTNQRWAP